MLVFEVRTRRQADFLWTMIRRQASEF